jgi:cytochrome c oxidase assembly factor CtaG
MLAGSLWGLAGLYALGVARAWRRAGFGQGVAATQTTAFIAGWMALAIALESPLHEWSERLFVAHMVQHELLMVVAAPLIALGAPLIAMLSAMPRAWRPVARAAIVAQRRSRVARWLAAPGAAFCLHALALWVWHIPLLYDAALADDRLHALQHASFFLTGVIFWWTVLHGRYGRAGYGASILYVFATALQSGALGALLALSERLWYPAYGGDIAGWSLSPLEDQQLAGFVMWIPAGLVFTGAGLAFLMFWLRESERRMTSHPIGRLADR